MFSQSELQLCQLIDTKAVVKQYETIYTKSLDCLEVSFMFMVFKSQRLRTNKSTVGDIKKVAGK
jgi:hypothetical protein